jgi:S-(hydroxymethyl)glutathione dehydrogenase/alcohol dehydrogenase
MVGPDHRSHAGSLACRAAIADGEGRFEFATVQVRAPGPGEVRVCVDAAGLCHTDLQSLHWPGPLVMGHEGAGRVESVGAGVDHLRPGDAVLLNWAIPCGRCIRCQSGEQHLCHRSHGIDAALGSPAPDPAGTTWQGRPLARAFHLGTFARYTLVRTEAVTALPDGPPAPQACILGCGVMTGVGAVVNSARVQAGDSVAVLGCGGVGLAVVQGARIAGAQRIIALDRREESVLRARRLGATDTVLVGEDDAAWAQAVAAVKALTGGAGADHAFEATGVHALAFAPLRLVRNGGTAVQLSGAHGQHASNVTDFWWDKRYLVPLYGGCQPARDLPQLAAWARDGSLDLDAMISHRYRLDQLSQALDDLRAGRLGKAVLRVDDRNDAAGDTA